MSGSNSTPSPEDAFDQIEEALASTENGRAFLAETRRRARSSETALLLDAVARLERRAARAGSYDCEDVRLLADRLEGAILEARAALIGSPASARDWRAASSVDALGREAANSILEAAEAIEETASRMRDAGFESSLCSLLVAQTSAVYAACEKVEHMLGRLGTIERTIVGADTFIGELRRALAGDGINDARCAEQGAKAK